MNGNKILVVCDPQFFDERHTLQMVYKAKCLAEGRAKEIDVVLAGGFNCGREPVFFTYGADRVINVRSELEFDTEVYVNQICKIVAKDPPELILIPASEFGKAVAAVLSVRLEAGLTADCIDIEYTGEYHFSRAAINDSVIAKIKCINCTIQMCTVKKDVFPLPEHSDVSFAVTGEVEIICMEGLRSENPGEAGFLEVISQRRYNRKPAADLHKYAVVFCVGRGVRQKELIDRIACIAKQCGACVVGTRAAVEENLIEKEYQVGQSGKNISPHVYIGFGVSGASQHMVGIKNAEMIIAVNHDLNAPIFQYADYSIVGDVEEIINEIENQIPMIRGE